MKFRLALAIVIALTAYAIHSGKFASSGEIPRPHTLAQSGE